MGLLLSTKCKHQDGPCFRYPSLDAPHKHIRLYCPKETPLLNIGALLKQLKAPQASRQPCRHTCNLLFVHSLSLRRFKTLEWCLNGLKPGLRSGASVVVGTRPVGKASSHHEQCAAGARERPKLLHVCSMPCQGITTDARPA